MSKRLSPALPCYNAIGLLPDRIDFRLHALDMMVERSISPDDVLEVLEKGEILREYPDDKPFPSMLRLGWIGERPIHVVSAYDIGRDAVIIVTVYEPTPDRWDAGFRRRIDR